jgi:REP-associated tyrosine transposase
MSTPLVNFPPKARITRLASSLRACPRGGCGWSSRTCGRHYWRARRLWSGSYFADSVGVAPISVLRQYIE